MNRISKGLSKLLLLILLLLLIPSITLIHAATLLSEDFEDGNSTGWSTSGGSWSVVTDGTRVYKQSSLSATAHAYSGTSTWANYSVQARVKALAFNGTTGPSVSAPDFKAPVIFMPPY